MAAPSIFTFITVLWIFATCCEYALPIAFKYKASNINIITETDIIEGLSRYIATEKPDMLAMLSRKHTLFERLFTQSITNKLAFRSEIPLLVMDE